MKYFSILSLAVVTLIGVGCKCHSPNCKKSCSKENAAMSASDTTQSNLEQTNNKMDTPTTDHEKTSYALGTIMANDLKKNGFDSIDVSNFQNGFRDVMNNDSLAVSEQEGLELFRAFAQKVQAKQQAEAEKNAGAAAEEGKAFLAENSKKEGVVTTESGLQYKITKKGDGTFPKATDRVKVHYEGKLIDGTIFDSSFERGQPIDFGLNQVIPGWTEGMQYINEGGEIELYIPYNLGYGERGAGGSIPPYAALIFRVQLLEVLDGHDHDHHGHDHNH